MYADENQKRALIDRQLCYCGVDDKGKWVIWPTDVECFIGEVQRNGLWREDVRLPIPLFGGVALAAYWPVQRWLFRRSLRALARLAESSPA